MHKTEQKMFVVFVELLDIAIKTRLIKIPFFFLMTIHKFIALLSDSLCETNYFNINFKYILLFLLSFIQRFKNIDQPFFNAKIIYFK